MKSKNKIYLNLLKIYKKILEIYPFLSKKEENNFTKNTLKILKNKNLEENQFKKYSEQILSLLGSNGHASVKENYKITKLQTKLSQKSKSPSFKIKNEILFIKIPSWSNNLGDISKELIDYCFKNVQKYNGVIIDVRENSGGNSFVAHKFAGIFFKNDVIYGEFRYKNKNGKIGKSFGTLIPNKKIFINKSLIILTSKINFSSNELFLAPFKISKRAILIGENTRGGSANSASIKIKINKIEYIVKIPTWKFFLKGQNKPIEQTAIKPDIKYKDKNIKKFAENYLLKILNSIKK